MSLLPLDGEPSTRKTSIARNLDPKLPTPSPVLSVLLHRSTVERTSGAYARTRWGLGEGRERGGKITGRPGRHVEGKGATQPSPGRYAKDAEKLGMDEVIQNKKVARARVAPRGCFRSSS